MSAPTSWIAATLVCAGVAASSLTPEPRPRPVPSAERPPAGFTGGFGEASCVECHIGNDVNAYGGRVTIEGLPEAYAAGRSYALTVVLEAEETSIAGFQIAARWSEGARAGTNAGRLSALDPRVALTDSSGVTYAHHTPPGTRPASAEGASWTLQWEAPADAAGPVAFHVAANSGNADNSPLSDLVYVGTQVVPPRQ